MTPQRLQCDKCYLCRNSWPRRRRNVLVSQGNEVENIVHDPNPSRSVEPKASGARCLCCFAGCIESSSASWHLLSVHKVLTSRGMHPASLQRHFLFTMVKLQPIGLNRAMLRRDRGLCHSSCELSVQCSDLS